LAPGSVQTMLYSASHAHASLARAATIDCVQSAPSRTAAKESLIEGLIMFPSLVP
jgi:hypothetical protein